MTKIACSIFLISLCTMGFAQKKTAAPAKPAVINIPMKPETWAHQVGKVEFAEYKGTPSMKILAGAGQVILKDLDFRDGTIEFDHEPIHPNFASFYFHYKDQKENECFYFRTARAGFPQAGDAVQYAPFIDGVNMWDMLYPYQANADFKKGQWNHVRLVISGKQMKVYVNASGNAKPNLVIPRLEGNTLSGTLAFDGESVISKLVLKPGQVDGLDSTAGFDLTDNDPRYLRDWQMTTPRETGMVDLDYNWVPKDSGTQWEPISAERMGLVNLTRKLGASKQRRIVWLKTTVNVPTAQTKKMQLGFSDEVWVLVNNRPVYVDKNWYFHPIKKEPAGRCSLENANFLVPLQQGDNTIMIGVANDFYGWGIMARLVDLASY
jgi:hypothetical protein